MNTILNYVFYYNTIYYLFFISDPKIVQNPTIILFSDNFLQ